MTIRRSMLMLGLAMAATASTAAVPPTAPRAKSHWESPSTDQWRGSKKDRKVARPRWRQ